MEQPSNSLDNVCVVCSDTTASPHFGVRNVCRACSAFFRRCVSDNKRFVCRMNGNCLIHKSQKCMCKFCRLQKCFEMGLLVAGVQGKRRSKGKSESLPVPHDIVALKPTYANIFQLPSTSKEPLFLKRLLQNYNDLRSVRRGTEKALYPENTRILQTEGPLAGHSMCTIEHVDLFGKAHLPSVVEFLHKSFEEFSELNEEEKWILIKPFHIYLQWLESCYMTFSKLPPHLFTTYSIISETLYWDVNHHSDHWFALDKAPAFIKDSLTQYSSQFCKREMEADKQKTLHEIARIRLSEMEMVALVGLLFWNCCVEGLDDRVQKLMRKVRTRIYEDLGTYHKQIGMPFSEERLGEVLNILNLLFIETQRFRSHLEFFSVFDALHEDDYFYKVIQGLK